VRKVGKRLPLESCSEGPQQPTQQKKIVPGCFAGSGCVCILYVCTESVLLVSRNLSVPTRQRESAVDPAVSGAKVSKVSRPMWHNTNVRI